MSKQFFFRRCQSNQIQKMKYLNSNIYIYIKLCYLVLVKKKRTKLQKFVDNLFYIYLITIIIIK